MPAGLDGNADPIVTAERSAVLTSVTEAALGCRTAGRPLMVAVDGIDGSGKSTFADELAAQMVAAGGLVVRSTIDWFHNPRAVRIERGATSPVGFYLDSHDLDALQTMLLEPFRSGSGRYVAGVFDEPSDAPQLQEEQDVEPDQVLIFDGIFVQRRELAEYWDFVVFLDAQERVDLRRLQYVLDDLPDEPVDVVAHTLEWQRRIDRYSSGMRYYLDLVQPDRNADMLIDNNNLAAPVIVRRR